MWKIHTAYFPVNRLNFVKNQITLFIFIWKKKWIRSNVSFEDIVCRYRLLVHKKFKFIQLFDAHKTCYWLHAMMSGWKWNNKQTINFKWHYESVLGGRWRYNTNSILCAFYELLHFNLLSFVYLKTPTKERLFFVNVK